MKKLIERTTRTPLPTDYLYLMEDSAVSDGKTQVKDIMVIPETTRTINFNNSMTATEIQDEINAVSRYIPPNIAITFQFADGTYNLDNQLVFNGFFGGGVLNIYGKVSEGDSLHTNQAVHLNFNNDTTGLWIYGCFLSQFRVQNLKVTCDDGYNCLYLLQNEYGIVLSNYFIHNGNSSSASAGIHAVGNGTTRVRNNYFSGNYMGIYSNHASYIYSEINDDTGTQPKYGLLARLSGVIGKASTQPAGSISNENIASGGIVR